jgi:hypothetical protein
MTEDDAQLRHLLRKAHQLPEPTWNLLDRATKRKSRAGKLLRQPKLSKATTSTTTNVERFLYDLEADEKARQGNQKR